MTFLSVLILSAILWAAAPKTPDVNHRVEAFQAPAYSGPHILRLPYLAFAAAPLIDPRATWLSITGTTAPPPVFKLVSMIYQDQFQSNGTANFYVTVVDSAGAPLAGVNVYQAWPDGNAVKQTDANGKTDFFMSGNSCFNPALGQVGPYSSYVESTTISDVLSGMGLPLCLHVSYLLVFRKVVSVTPPPTTAKTEQ